MVQGSSLHLVMFCNFLSLSLAYVASVPLRTHFSAFWPPKNWGKSKKSAQVGGSGEARERPTILKNPFVNERGS